MANLIETKSGTNLSEVQISKFTLSETGSKSKLGVHKQNLIIEALKNSDVSEVYRRGNKIFKHLLNGCEVRIA